MIFGSTGVQELPVGFRVSAFGDAQVVCWCTVQYVSGLARR
jgi:hypothetical protein